MRGPESNGGISINKLSKSLGLASPTVVRETRDMVPPIKTEMTKAGERIDPNEVSRIVEYLKEHGVAVRDPQASH